MTGTKKNVQISEENGLVSPLNLYIDGESVYQYTGSMLKIKVE